MAKKKKEEDREEEVLTAGDVGEMPDEVLADPEVDQPTTDAPEVEAEVTAEPEPEPEPAPPPEPLTLEEEVKLLKSALGFAIATLATPATMQVIKDTYPRLFED